MDNFKECAGLDWAVPELLLLLPSPPPVFKISEVVSNDF